LKVAHSEKLALLLLSHGGFKVRSGFLAPAGLLIRPLLVLSQNLDR
jgi:hypothetical protein